MAHNRTTDAHPTAQDREPENAERPEWLTRFLRMTHTSRQALLEEVLGREITGDWPPFWVGLYGEVRERGLVDRLAELVMADD